MNAQLTAASAALFMRFAHDAGNWNGMPLLDVSAAERGNLTDLKKNGLLTTFRDEGCDWVQFTEAGKAFALQNNIQI